MSKALRPRRGLKSVANELNPVLAEGEVLFTYTDPNYGSTASTSTNEIYLGDGSTSFTNLEPFIGVATTVTSGSNKLVTSDAVYRAIDESITQVLNTSF